LSKLYLDAQMERQRARLQAEAFERETRFAKLHEKRAEVVAEVYSRLVRTHSHFKSMTSPFEFAGGPSKQEIMKIAVESANSFATYFQEHRIFLEAELYAALDGFDRKLSEAFGSFHRSQDSERAAFYAAKGLDEWDKARKVVTDEIPELEKAIEQSFRKLLGVS